MKGGHFSSLEYLLYSECIHSSYHICSEYFVFLKRATAFKTESGNKMGDPSLLLPFLYLLMHTFTNDFFMPLCVTLCYHVNEIKMNRQWDKDVNFSTLYSNKRGLNKFLLEQRWRSHSFQQSQKIHELGQWWLEEWGPIRRRDSVLSEEMVAENQFWAPCDNNPQQ